jgi:hypothetical protein
MTVIAIPSGHQHLADALVRELGYRQVHVDQPLRDLAVKLDPIVEPGHALANMGRSPRLARKVEDGDWDGAIRRCPEIGAFLERLREQVGDERYWAEALADIVNRDVVLVGVDSPVQAEAVGLSGVGAKFVHIEGRPAADLADLVIPEGSIIEHEGAIVRYAKSLALDARRQIDPLQAVEFAYAAGFTDDDLHFPVDTPQVDEQSPSV